MHRNRQARVEPPVAPGGRRNPDCGRGIKDQQGLCRSRHSLGLAAAERERQQEQGREHHPPERDDSPALIFEQALRQLQRLQNISPEQGQSNPNAS